jgi:hypothetical protein
MAAELTAAAELEVALELKDLPTEGVAETPCPC